MLHPKVNVKYLTFLCLLFFHSLLLAQPVSYWQQQVDYKINVKLNDSLHQLDAFISIDYTNHAPESLDFIYFHLWPNAYKNDNTAFAKQMILNEKTSFYYADDKDRGYIDSLAFEVNGIHAKVQLDSNYIDIAKVWLNHPLAKGEKVTITTPFRVKIPASFSRLGHVGQQYQITQWYPKPAVYDKDGWHQIPYLDQGEFYSEFGTFDVRIAVPKNYKIAASGDLMDSTEQKWLDTLAAQTPKAVINDWDNAFPKSDKLYKTVHYHLENAHDFAWFADKRYSVRKGEVILPITGRKVTTYTMFTNRDADTWAKSIDYVNDAILFYSKSVGEYPYHECTAVEGGLQAGSGMEYPTITVIGSLNSASALEDVIVHEVGHNWFYGVLASNERQHPWMDEGMNTFMEYNYLNYKYPDKKLLGVPNFLAKLFQIDGYKQSYIQELAYRFQSLKNEDQPIELPADKYSSINYGAMVYMKTALAMNHLKGYLGAEMMDKCLHAYFDQWQFKHPTPKDVQQVFEQTSGKKLDWFFGEYLRTTKKVDYAIKSVKKHDDDAPSPISVSNKGDLNVPFSISALKKDSVLKTIWYNGCAKDTVINFPPGKYDYFRIDGKMQMMTDNRKNDTYRTRGVLRKSERIRFQFLGGIDNPYRNQLYFTPVIAGNNYDKTMLGLAFYNHCLPGKHFEYELVPMIGLGSLTFDGVGHIGYTFTPKKTKLKAVNLSLYGKRFSYQTVPDLLTYNKVQPQLTFDFRPKDVRGQFFQTLSFRSVTIFQQIFDYPLDDAFAPYYFRRNFHYTINEVSYTVGDKRALYPYSIGTSLQQGNNFIKLATEAKFLITYEKPGKGLSIRLFGGAFLWNNTNGYDAPDPGFRLYYGTGNGQYQKDYLFDELYLGRNESSGFFSQQVVYKDAGFRTPNVFGTSVKSWIVALNLNATIPKRIPIRPYVNVAAFGQKTYDVNTGNSLSSTTIAFEAGLALVIVPEILEVNLPLFFATKNSDNTSISGSWNPGKGVDASGNILAGKKYYELITYVFNINKLNPTTLLKTIKL